MFFCICLIFVDFLKYCGSIDAAIDKWYNVMSEEKNGGNFL